jgi:hypothetical protein
MPSHTTRRVRHLAITVALAALPFSSHAQSATSIRDLDAYIQTIMKEWGVPGLAIAVVKDDSVVFIKGYGVLENGKPTRADEHTRFAIGSTTKAMTSAGLAMLVTGLAPEVLVVVGEITRAWNRVGPMVAEAVKARSFTQAGTRIVSTDPDAQPRLRGTIALVLQKHFGAPFIA